MKTAACGVLALNLLTACSLAPWSGEDRGDPDRRRADASLESGPDAQGGPDGSPLGDAARDSGPCELRSEYGTEDIESFGIIQCTDRGSEYLDIGAVFLDTCGTRVLWHAMYFSGSSDVVPGTYQVEFRGYPRIGGRYGEPYVEPILCFAGTGGTAVLNELVDYERAAGSFEDVTVAEASCDDPFEPPADSTPLFRVSFTFDGWPEPKCPGE